MDIYTTDVAAARLGAACSGVQAARSPWATLAVVAAGPRYTRQMPYPITMEVLERGRERYNIYCAVCHDRVGTGKGRIVMRGYLRPPSFHSDRLRDVPDGYIFSVITNGHRP